MSWAVVGAKQGLSWAFKHRYLFGIPIATLTALATFYAVRLPDQFTTRTTLEVRDLTGAADMDLPGERNVGLHRLMIVAKDRLLSQRPVQAVVPVLVRQEGLTRVEALDAARAKIRFEQTTDYSFEIAITDTSAERAYDASQRLVETFLEEERSVPLRRAEREAELATERRDQRRSDLDKVQRKVEQVQLDNAATLPDKRDSIFQELVTCRGDLTAAELQQSRLGDKRARDDQDLIRLDKTGVGTPRVETRDEQAFKLQQISKQERLGAAQRHHDQMRLKYKPGYPKYDSAKADLDRAQREYDAISAELRRATQKADRAHAARASGVVAAEREALQNQRAQIASQLVDLKSKIESLEEKRADAQSRLARVDDTKRALQPLLAAVDRAEQALEKAARRLDEEQRLATFYRDSPLGEVTRFRVTQDAVVPVKPSGPARMRIVFTAILLGCVIGYLLLLLGKRFGDSQRVTARELNELLPGALVVGIPMLGSGQRRISPPIREGLLAGWMIGCLTLTVVAIASWKGLIDAPAWLDNLLGRG